MKYQVNLTGTVKMNFSEFQNASLQKGIQNDSTNVWITPNGIGGIQANVPHNITETYPFEVSTSLETNIEHPLWDDLYEDYLSNIERRIEDNES